MDYHSYVLLPILIAFLLLLLTYWFYKSRSTSEKTSELPDIEQETSESLPDKLGQEEKELIHNIVEFQEGIVREVMIPRIDIVAVEESTSLREFRLLAVEKGHSRIPVYRETIDYIVGIAYVKDMLHYWEADEKTTIVTSFMRPPYFVPETKNLESLLHEFQVKKVHIAVVIDEYGGTAGIVTIEDLLEEVFGEIIDEHDEEEEELITVIDENTIEVNAKVGIDELEEYVGELSIEHQDIETVGGLLSAILGEIPKEEETVDFQNLRFTVLNADRHRVIQVKVERISEQIESGIPEQ